MSPFSRFTWPPDPGRTVLVHETCRSDSRSYVYDASGQRVEKTTASGSVYYPYDLAGQVISELNSSGGWNRGEIYASGRHLATYVSSTTYFAHGDWLGTERARTNVSGDISETCQGLPFGDGLSCSGSDVSPLHFTGDLPRRGRGQHDSETGLALFASRMALRDDYFGARYDSSNTGRFMTPDWSAKVDPVPYAKLGDPQSLNLYTYAGDNPVTTLDPNGHCVEDACVGEGTAVLITGAVVFTMETIRYYQQNPDASAAVAADAHAAGQKTSSTVAAIGGFIDTAAGRPITTIFRKSKSAGEMASDLSKQMGKGSVPYQTPSAAGHIDLRCECWRANHSSGDEAGYPDGKKTSEEAKTMTATEWLQEWYGQACNGTWEHVYGIRIDTLDNPGWQVEIDLAGTPYAHRPPYQLAVENSATDWLRCSTKGERFVGYGDPGKLEAIFSAFKEWVEEQRGPLGSDDRPVRS